ncbi:hypothetical protein BRE01_28160 [Brevibacillus reuszeri]|uniref:GH10 domain-containing protein n=2 Tax=Brevibacillus reuszeri TaxID=54915 RepID=A0ABQ0TNN1_9BACL|nr:hypothetical protein BRE01_28160 [Brevibacillus reuszeri]
MKSPMSNNYLTGPIDRRFFGIQIEDVNNARPLGFGLMRLETNWREIEKSKGNFEFSKVDKYVAFATQNNLDIIMLLGQPPDWATGGKWSSDYGSYYNSIPPSNIQDWRNYILALGQRYKGKIMYYEVWNEANLSGFYSGTLEKLVELTMEAYKTLKAVDPNIQIISPSYTGASGVSGMGDFLRAGGANWIDIVGVHLYGYPKPPEAMIDLAYAYRKTITQAGAGSLPVWNTESSWNSYYYKGILYGSDENDYSNQMPDDLAIAYIHRMFLCNWVAGMNRAVFYGMDQPWSRIRLLDLAHLPNVAATGRAYQRMVDWLTGATIHQYVVSREGVHTVSLTYPDGRAGYILWTDDDRSVLFPLSAELAISQTQAADGTALPTSDAITVTNLPLYVKLLSSQVEAPVFDRKADADTELLYNHDFRMNFSDSTFPIGWELLGMSASKYSGTDSPADKTVLTLTPAGQYGQILQRLKKPLQKGYSYKLAITYKLPPATTQGKWGIGFEVSSTGTPFIDEAYLPLTPQDTFLTRDVSFFYDFGDPDPSPDLRLTLVNLSPDGQQQTLYVSSISLTQIGEIENNVPHAYNITYSPIVPSAGSFTKGDQFLFTDADLIASEGIGWVCTASGTFGTLKSVNGSLTNGSNVLVVTKADALSIGDYVKIGTDPNVYLVSYQQSPTRYELGSTAKTTQANQAVSYSAPTFAPLAQPAKGKPANPTVPTIGRSPYVLQNTNAYPLDVLVAKGSVSLIEFSRNGTTWYDTGLVSGIVRLAAGDRIRITYTTAPKITLVPQ